jgi:hypothetical protein
MARVRTYERCGYARQIMRDEATGWIEFSTHDQSVRSHFLAAAKFCQNTLARVVAWNLHSTINFKCKRVQSQRALIALDFAYRHQCSLYTHTFMLFAAPANSPMCVRACVRVLCPTHRDRDSPRERCRPES